MDRGPITLRIPRRWAKTGLVTLVAALILAPVGAWASNVFTDVPDSNQFHDDIEWMKDNGITNGCNPAEGNTRYCPTDNVTRQQMAAFMRRLATNGVVDAATAVEADTLDGKDSVQLEGTVHAISRDWNSDGQLNITGLTNVLELELETPDAGYIVVNGGWTLRNDTGANAYVYSWLQLDDNTCEYADRIRGTSVYAETTGVNDDFSSQATSTVVPVAQGAHTVSLCVGKFTGGQPNVLDAYVTSVFAGGGSGVSLATLGDTSDPDPSN